METTDNLTGSPCTNAEQSDSQTMQTDTTDTAAQHCEHCANNVPQAQNSSSIAAKHAQRYAALKQRSTAVTEDLHRSSGLALREFGQKLVQSLSLGAGSTVAAYVSMGTEIPTGPLLEWLYTSDLRIIVPRLGTLSALSIDWARYRGEIRLHNMPKSPSGGLRPREPEGRPLGREALREADLVLVPALGVASDGSRLGRGAGWYDRALMSAKKGTPVVAVCWSWEMNAQVPHEAHDIPVNATLSEQGLTWIP